MDTLSQKINALLDDQELALSDRDKVEVLVAFVSTGKDDWYYQLRGFMGGYFDREEAGDGEDKG